MASKKKKGNPHNGKPLFRLEERGGTADGKGKLYCGYVGGYEIGCVVAANQTKAKTKLIAIARRLLK